jgi:uncharacterized protein (UPF0248 family)
MNPKHILNKLKWHEKFDLSKAEIWYLHRGAPNNTKIIKGDEIVDLEKSFIKTETAMIPYHRVLKIIYEKEVFFERLR